MQQALAPSHHHTTVPSQPLSIILNTNSDVITSGHAICATLSFCPSVQHILSMHTLLNSPFAYLVLSPETKQNKTNPVCRLGSQMSDKTFKGSSRLLTLRVISMV